MLAFLFEHIDNPNEEPLYPGAFNRRFALMFVVRHVDHMPAVSSPRFRAELTWRNLGCELSILF
jgi:hypothetical protein